MSGTVAITIFMVVLANLSYELMAGVVSNNEKTVKACGSKLANLLSQVCHGEYVGKKLIPELDEADYSENSENAPVITYYDNADANYRHRMKRSLPFSKVLKVMERIDVGLADECCRKSCSLNRLISYCQLFDIDT